MAVMEQGGSLTNMSEVRSSQPLMRIEAFTLYVVDVHGPPKIIMWSETSAQKWPHSA